MSCQHTEQHIDDYFDGTLPLPQREALERHAAECEHCSRRIAQEQTLRRALRSLPFEPASPGFAARALRAAREQPAQATRSHRRGFVTGFASALAAGFVLWVVAGLYTPLTTTPPTALPEVALAMDQERIVNVVFHAPQDMQEATLAIYLPEQTEIAGYPGMRELTWQTSLRQGENLLALPMIARGHGSGELVAAVIHDGKRKEFRVRLGVQPQHQSQLHSGMV